jgi:peptide/nickel transport system substrate-binding protein
MNKALLKVIVLLVLLAASLGLAQKAGGTVSILLPEDLPTLNPYLSTAFITLQVSPAVIEPLVGVDPQGEYYPVLAAEVPSPENGGVSEDGLSITWRLKEGITWSDGTPLTAADVVFTYQAAANASNGSVRSSSYDKVLAVEALDDLNVQISYSEFDTSYLDAFQWGILPQHASGAAEDMANWAFNRLPVGTGPFVVDDWRSGDRILMSKNPNYRIAGRPYLDRAEFLVVPSQETRAAMMTRGEADVMLWPGSGQQETLEASPNVQVDLIPAIWIMRMFLNLGERGNPVLDQAPHPILGDLRVRQALAYGIDYELITDVLAEGEVSRATSPFELGWYDCNITGYSYDLERAKALLDEAGWVMGRDGIRVAEGALYAPDGTRLSLEMMGYTGYRLLEQTELVLTDMYRELGVELKLSNVEQSVIFGGWSDRAARKTGDYDILIYDTGAGINPQSHVDFLLHSKNIPSEENEGAGGNYSRWANSDADALLDIAGSNPSLTVRKDAYCQVAELINQDLPHIYLYLSQDNNARSIRLQGVDASTWAGLVWDIDSWWLE